MQKLHSYPTFDECFSKWYDLNIKAMRWTHKDSLKRPKVAYTHIKTKLSHLPVNAIPRSLVKSVLQDMYVTVTNLAGKMRGYCEEIFENALDDRQIGTNPVSPAKNFTVPIGRRSTTARLTPRGSLIYTVTPRTAITQMRSKPVRLL